MNTLIDNVFRVLLNTEGGGGAAPSSAPSSGTSASSGDGIASIPSSAPSPKDFGPTIPGADIFDAEGSEESQAPAVKPSEPPAAPTQQQQPQSGQVTLSNEQLQ